MTDVLGPADAGAVNTLTTTTDVSNPTAGDTWFQDCVANNPATGTNLPSRFMNRALQQIRRIIRLSGIPQSNSDDDMLGQAIQAGTANWGGTFGGTANVLTATLSPSVPMLTAGLRISGISAAANTGSSTLNVNGLGPVAIGDVHGNPVPAGYWLTGSLLTFQYDGTVWRTIAGRSALSTAFSTSNVTNQSVTLGVLTQINFGSGTFTNVGSISGNTFTFTRPGSYFVGATAIGSISPTAAGNISGNLELQKNGVLVQGTFSQVGTVSGSSGTYPTEPAFTATIIAAAGDALTLFGECVAVSGTAKFNPVNFNLQPLD